MGEGMQKTGFAGEETVLEKDIPPRERIDMDHTPIPFPTSPILNSTNFQPPLNSGPSSSNLPRFRVLRTLSTPTAPTNSSTNPSTFTIGPPPPRPSSFASVLINSPPGSPRSRKFSRSRDHSPLGGIRNRTSRLSSLNGGGGEGDNARDSFASSVSTIDPKIPYTPPSTREERILRALKAIEIVKEIWESEKNYGDGLRMVLEVFVDGAEGRSGSGMGVQEEKTIFGGVREIEGLSKEMSEALENVIEGVEAGRRSSFDKGKQREEVTGKENHQSRPSSFASSEAIPIVPRISSTLIHHLPFLSLYYPYIIKFPLIITTLDQLKSTSPSFSNWLKERHQDERCRKLELGHWLLGIVQRIPRWGLLLRRLIREIDDVQEREGLVKALMLSERSKYKFA